MRVTSICPLRPAAIFRWPTSLFRICHFGSPTNGPLVWMSVFGYSRSSRSYVGLRASAMALALVSARYPQPSRIMRTRGLGRDINSLLAPGFLALGFRRQIHTLRYRHAEKMGERRIYRRNDEVSN